MARNLLLVHSHRRSLPATAYDFVFSRSIATDPLGVETSAERAKGGADVIRAQVRHEDGTKAAVRTRRAGRTPGILFSLPGESSILVSMESKHVKTLLRTHERSGLLSQVFDLQLERDDGPPSIFPVLPRTLHRDPVTDEPENLAMMYCPPERRVRVPVRIKVVGEELSPGVKKGGYLNLIQRQVQCVGPAAAIPKELELDVSSLDFGHRITLSDLSLPSEVSIKGVAAEHPVCKIAGKSSRD